MEGGREGVGGFGEVEDFGEIFEVVFEGIRRSVVGGGRWAVGYLRCRFGRRVEIEGCTSKSERYRLD